MNDVDRQQGAPVITAAKRVEAQRVLSYSPGGTSRNDAAYLSFCLGMSAWIWLIVGGVIIARTPGLSDAVDGEILAAILWLPFGALALAAIIFGYIGLTRRRICVEHETHLAKAGLWLGWTPFILLGVALGLMWLFKRS